jgi:hypothetical protein
VNKIAAYLRRGLALLELARSNAETARIRYRSRDLGSWSSVNPSWRILSGRIRFQFCDRGCTPGYRVVSIRQTAPGVSVLLADPRSPIPESFDISWRQTATDSPDPGRLWKITKQWLSARFPSHRILRATRRSDLARTLSGLFLRIRFRDGGRNRLLIAAGEASGDGIHTVIGQSLLWLSATTCSKNSKGIPTIYFLVPFQNSAVVSHRCQFLNKNRIRTEIWDYRDGTTGDFEFHKTAPPPPPEEDKDFRWPVLGPFRWSSSLQRVLDLAPELIRRYPRFREYDSLRLWGLEFAQVTGADRDRVLFGVGTQREELTADNFDSLRKLVGEILFYRRPDTPDTRHLFYRLQAERWLEALVLEDIPHLFPEMSPESVYSQIPVYLGKDSGRIDILGADRQGTLVVVELKVAADPDLPVQALDYWGRVIQHNENGDFERRGYFSEIRLTRERPRIYLVSPVFSFHETTEVLLHYLESDLQVWKISINEDWRCGVRIVRRTQLTCKDVATCLPS